MNARFVMLAVCSLALAGCKVASQPEKPLAMGGAPFRHIGAVHAGTLSAQSWPALFGNPELTHLVDLAVGVIIGAAFGAIVNSLVNDLIMPIIGAITGGLDFSNYFISLSSKVTATSLADAKKQGAVLAWGSFITIALNFLIIAWVLFLCIKGINKLKAPEAPAKPAGPSPDVQLPTEIRDALKKG